MISLLMTTAWGRMWSMAVFLFLIGKGLSWTGGAGWTWRRGLGYFVAWPGMDSPAFLAPARQAIPRPTLSEWAWAASKLAWGILLLWEVAPRFAPLGSLVQAWVGMIGLTFVLHFGLFHLLSCCWRSVGIDARPIMDWPIIAGSVGEFWGSRWNRAFRDLTHACLFVPLTKRLGPRGALLAGFVVSGLVHDLVLSWPAQGGWGWPTLYFVVQGVALLLERSRWGRRLGLGRGWRGRMFAIAVIVLPCPWLFHEPFVRNVMIPFLTALGAMP
ncbi:MAG: MBOAT family protein [Planctomycetales bacterium]